MHVIRSKHHQVFVFLVYTIATRWKRNASVTSCTCYLYCIVLYCIVLHCIACLTCDSLLKWKVIVVIAWIHVSQWLQMASLFQYKVKGLGLTVCIMETYGSKVCSTPLRIQLNNDTETEFQDFRPNPTLRSGAGGNHLRFRRFFYIYRWNCFLYLGNANGAAIV